MNFGIIGYGRFGQLWAKCLADFGIVKIYDQDPEALKCDYLFVIVPIGKFEEVCRKIKSKVPSETVIVDACSVKKYPSEVMRKVFSKKQSLIATHPLFGPDSVKQLGLKGRKIVLCPLRINAEKLGFLKQLFKKMELEIFECTPEEHDKQMAKSQALVHFVGRGLAALGLKEQELCTPDYEALLRIDNIVNNDTWQLFFDMQRYNPYVSKNRKKFLEKLQNLDAKIEQSSDLIQARKNIDELDRNIIRLLGERFKLSAKIGAWKKMNDKPIRDEKREAKLKILHARQAKKSGIPSVLVEDLFEDIFDASRNLQNK